MAPPKLNATTRYTPPGVRKYYWVTTIATYTSPTRAEMNAGTDLSDEVAEISGFTLAADDQAAPDLASSFTAQVPGRQTAEASEIVCYASSNSNDVRTVLPKGTAGYVLILPEGDVATQKMEVWPAKVKSMFIDPNIEEPGKVHVLFSITRLPAQNVAIPA